MSLQLAIVLFQDTPTLSASDVTAYLSANWSNLPVASETGEEDNTISFRLGTADVAIGIMPAPVPWADLEGPCATGRLWPDSAAALSGHAAHAIVTMMGELPAIQLSSLLTQVTAAVCGASTQSLGVFWTNAVMVVRKDVFLDFATQILPKGSPLPIWVDFRVGRTESGNASAGFTAGLAALGLMEIEAQDATESPSELRQRLEAIAQYLVEHAQLSAVSG